MCLLHAEIVDDVAFLGGYASFECRNIGSTGNEYDTITRFVPFSFSFANVSMFDENVLIFSMSGKGCMTCDYSVTSTEY